ncbi:MAG: hypothetical protein ACYCOU_15045 [Sulfobacillus sp.]
MPTAAPEMGEKPSIIPPARKPIKIRTKEMPSLTPAPAPAPAVRREIPDPLSESITYYRGPGADQSSKTDPEPEPVEADPPASVPAGGEPQLFGVRKKIFQHLSVILGDSVAAELEREILKLSARKAGQLAPDRLLEGGDLDAQFHSIYQIIARHWISYARLHADALRSRTLSVAEFATWSRDKLCPEFWGKLAERAASQVTDKVLSRMQGTDMFFCGRCKKRNTTYYQSQDRSSDEPMTTHITCLECGNRWRQ